MVKMLTLIMILVLLPGLANSSAANCAFTFSTDKNMKCIDEVASMATRLARDKGGRTRLLGVGFLAEIFLNYPEEKNGF